MRKLTNSELSSIAGGMYCTDKDGFSKIVWNAVSDGLHASGILSTITGALTYAASTHFATKGVSAGIGLGAGLLLAPVYAGVGMYYSSAWDIFN